jgi:hypothetical protein
MGLIKPFGPPSDFFFCCGSITDLGMTSLAVLIVEASDTRGMTEAKRRPRTKHMHKLIKVHGVEKSAETAHWFVR